MKVARLVIGIISLVLCVLILFQSCAAGVVEALEENEESTASSAGVVVAIMFLVAGIVGICTRKGVVGGFVCTGIYTFGGIVGLAGYGFYEDLVIWSVLALIFAVVFLVTSIVMKKQQKVYK